MTNVILSWVIPIICNVGLVLFGFWMGNLSCRKEKARYKELVDKLMEREEILTKELEEYTSKTCPVSYYYNPAGRQALERYALANAGNWWWAPYSHKFEDIEVINILEPKIFIKTIALAVRDYGYKVKETATEIKVWQEIATVRSHETVLKKETKEK